MAEPSATSAARRRRQRRRRRLVAGLAAGAVVIAGAGTAWAVSGDDAPAYRYATVTKADVSQTVDVDGALAAADTASLAFAAGGTVASVGVAVGDTVTAGQAVATLDPTDLDAAVTTARAALAAAQETLAGDRSAQANGTTVSADTGSGTAAAGGTTGGSTGATAASFVTSGATVQLAAAVTPTKTGSSNSIVSAQNAVVRAQRALDSALAAQDAAVSRLVNSCATGDDTDPATVTVTAGADGTAQGTVGGAAVVTLRTADGDLAETSSTNPQRVARGGNWTFAGLAVGDGYRVVLASVATIDTDGCVDAVDAVSSGQKTLDKAHTTLRTGLAALTRAIATTTGSGTGGTGGQSTCGTSGGSSRSGAAGSQSPAPSGGTSSGTSGGTTGATSGGTSGGNTAGSAGGVAVTAERIAADVKAVDAKQAAVAVAKQARTHATLTSTIGGTVAAVGLAAGDSVTAGSSSSTITVVGTGSLSATVDIALADIDLVKVGQSAAVTVDGRTAPVPATVTFIGTTDTASGSSPSYPVTVTLTRRYASLYDGMGASLAIAVGTASDVLTVPLSAVHTTARGTTVTVRDGDDVTSRTVTTGLTGADRVQIRSGLTAGQQVVLAETSASVPTSTTNTRTGFGGGNSGGGAGGFGGAGGGPPGR